MVGKSWQQELEASGHIVSAVQETGRDECWCSTPFLLLIHLEPWDHGMVSPALIMGLLD